LQANIKTKLHDKLTRVTWQYSYFSLRGSITVTIINISLKIFRFANPTSIE